MFYAGSVVSRLSRDLQISQKFVLSDSLSHSINLEKSLKKHAFKQYRNLKMTITADIITL